jgi:hypothetical protein
MTYSLPGQAFLALVIVLIIVGIAVVGILFWIGYTTTWKAVKRGFLEAQAENRRNQQH